MSKKLVWCPQVQEACCEIVEHSETPEWVKGVVVGFMKYGKEHNELTSKQASSLGGFYKWIVNNGIYVKHDWWQWR